MQALRQAVSFVCMCVGVVRGWVCIRKFHGRVPCDSIVRFSSLMIEIILNNSSRQSHLIIHGEFSEVPSSQEANMSNTSYIMCGAVLCFITQLCPTPCDPMGICPWGSSKQENWSGLPCPPPGDLPGTGIEPRSPSLQADSLPSEPPGESIICNTLYQKNK